MKTIPIPDPPVPALEVRSVSKNYGAVRALDGITLSIPRGELFGLLGPNGAGKSTLINIITGPDLMTGCVIPLEGGQLISNFQLL